MRGACVNLLFCLLLYASAAGWAAECDVSMVSMDNAQVVTQVDCGPWVSDVDFSQNDVHLFAVKIPNGNANLYFIAYVKFGQNTYSACADGCTIDYGKMLTIMKPFPPSPPMSPAMAGALQAILMLLLSD